MKYRLPGVYLGNISMDLFMEYIKIEDLSDRGNLNQHSKTPERKQNITLHKVEFKYDGVDYNFITHNIYSKEVIDEFVSNYFPVSDTSGINYTITKEPVKDSYFFYDTLGGPSTYDLIMEDLDGNINYMVGIEFESKMIGIGQLKEHSESKPNEMIKVSIIDLRYKNRKEIKEVWIDTDEISVDEFEMYSTKEAEDTDYIGEVRRGRLISLNELDQDGSFVYLDKIGRRTKTPNKNNIWKDIMDNRELLGTSLESQILSPINYPRYQSIAGIIQIPNKTKKEPHFTLTKFDEYHIKKLFTQVDIMNEDIPILVDDIEKKLIDQIETNTYNTKIDQMVRYETLLNTKTLPRYSAIYQKDGNESSYFVYKSLDEDPIQGIKRLNLMDLNELHARVRNKNGNGEKLKVNYTRSSDYKYIYRIIKIDNKNYYVRISVDEEGMSGSIMIPSNGSVKPLNSKKEVIEYFPLDKFNITPDEKDVFQTSFLTDSGELLSENWAVRFYMPSGEISVLPILDSKTLKLDMADTNRTQWVSESYIPNAEIENKYFIEYPIDISLVNLNKSVLNSSVFTEIYSANFYESKNINYFINKNGFQKPELDQNYLDEQKPYNNIESFLKGNEYKLSSDQKYYNKEYYLVNQYDQTKIYKVEEQIVLNTNRFKNPYPHDKTFDYIYLEDNVNNNTLNNIVNYDKDGKFNHSINIETRGRLIDSDVLGSDLIDTLRSDFRKSFNTLFYGMKDVSYTAEMDMSKMTEEKEIDLLKYMLVDTKSFSVTLDKFLEVNFRNYNDVFYIMDDNFRLGIYAHEVKGIGITQEVFSNWMTEIKNRINPDSYNTLERIKMYETFDEESLLTKLIIDDAKQNKSKKIEGLKETGYRTKVKPKPENKDIDNLQVIKQGFDMMMDSRYSVLDTSVSFEKINIYETIIKDDKTQEMFDGKHENVRYLNTNQNIETMIRSYMGGYTRKAGGGNE